MCPSMCACGRHLANMIELMLPLTHPSPQPKRQVDRFSRFWRPFVKWFMLWYWTVLLSCSVSLSVLSCLSVTLVYCGQTVGWIKTKLSTEVGLGSGRTVLDGDPAPPPTFRPMSVVAKWLDALKCHLVWR